MTQEKQQTQDKQPAETIKQQLPILQWRMDYMRSPEDAVLKWDVSYEKWFRGYYGQLVKEVAQATGADPAQIANKATRTPEQDRLLTEAAARRQIARIEAFFDSAYMDALTTLDPLQGAFNDPNDAETGADAATYISVKEQAVLYFFATHDGIKPTEPTKLTAEQREELTDIYKKLDAYYAEHATGDPIQSPDILFAFIEQENPAPEKVESIAKNLPLLVESVRLKDFDFPVDKVNKTIWRLLEKHSQGDQIAIHMEAHTSKDPVLLYYAISFEGLENQGIKITKKLTAFEKRVYIAAGALYAIKGQKPFTYTELYYAMGYTGKPGSNDLEKLAAAVLKMRIAQIFVDNREEIAAKYHYPKFVYDGSLLPSERVTAIVDGNITDAAIQLLREPPLIAFARQREQITKINIKLLQSPASKTEANIALEDYLIERIAQARNERRKLEKKRCKTDEERRKKVEALEKDTRIVFATLYEHADITTVKQKQRAPQKVKRILEHYKACNFIRDFTMETDGVKITL